jgi:hypothetical protein
MSEVEKELPEGIAIQTIYDTSDFVLGAIDEVYKTLLEAVGLVALVVLVFLGSLRSTVIPIAAIPCPCRHAPVDALFGFSLNLPTLFGSCWRSASWSTTRSWWSRTSSANLTELHLPPKEGGDAGDARGVRRRARHLAGADGGVPAHRGAAGHQRPALPPVRADHRGQHVLQRGVRADLEPGPVGRAAARARRGPARRTSTSEASTGHSAGSPRATRA